MQLISYDLASLPFYTFFYFHLPLTFPVRRSYRPRGGTSITSMVVVRSSEKLRPCRSSILLFYNISIEKYSVDRMLSHEDDQSSLLSKQLSELSITAFECTPRMRTVITPHVVATLRRMLTY